jgi:hypothetical protein
MKTYPLAPVPSVAGLYALYHSPTRRIYIGKSVDLQRRFQEWRGVLVSGLGMKSFIMRTVIGETTIDDWDFKIAQLMPGATEQELTEAEQAFIQRAIERSPGQVLNSLLPLSGRGAAPVSVTAPKSTIYWNGQQVSYSVAARELGTSVHQLQRRLRKFRERGRTEVDLEDMIALTKKYRVADKEIPYRR